MVYGEKEQRHSLRRAHADRMAHGAVSPALASAKGARGVVLNSLKRLANAVWRSVQMHVDAGGDTGNYIESGPCEDALRRKCLQCYRNSQALVRLEAGFVQGAAENKAYTLSELVHRLTQHPNSDGRVVVEGVHGVVGGRARKHSGSPVRCPNVSGAPGEIA